MVPSLHWILLLWGLQGLWAEDYDDDPEEEVVTSKKKNKLFSSNLVPQNGKLKGSELSFSFIFCFLLKQQRNYVLNMIPLLEDPYC